MMNKLFLICMAGFLLTAVAFSACTLAAASARISQMDSSCTGLSEIRIGRVKHIEGSNSFEIEYGDMSGAGASFLAGGRRETLTLPEAVPITASIGGVTSSAAAYQIGPGSLLKLQYAGGSLHSVTLLNDEPAAFARQVKAAFLSEDISRLDGLMSYPCYVHVSPEGKGWIIKDSGELSSISKIVFADSIMNTLKAFDATAIEPVQSNVIIGGVDGPPAVTFCIDSDGKPGITGISVAD